MHRLIKDYILDCITYEYDGYIGKRNRVDYLLTCFRNECFPRNFNPRKTQPNVIDTLAEWLQGLPSCCSFDYKYVDIIYVAVKWSTEMPNLSCYTIINDWWKILANGIRELTHNLGMTRWYSFIG